MSVHAWSKKWVRERMDETGEMGGEARNELVVLPRGDCNTIDCSSELLLPLLPLSLMMLNRSLYLGVEIPRASTAPSSDDVVVATVIAVCG